VLVELIVTIFIATYVLLVALGHVLLVIAIYKCLREDGIRGSRQRSPASPQMATDDAKSQQSASPPSQLSASLMRMAAGRSP